MNTKKKLLVSEALSTVTPVTELTVVSNWEEVATILGKGNLKRISSLSIDNVAKDSDTFKTLVIVKGALNKLLEKEERLTALTAKRATDASKLQSLINKRNALVGDDLELETKVAKLEKAISVSDDTKKKLEYEIATLEKFLEPLAIEEKIARDIYTEMSQNEKNLFNLLMAYYYGTLDNINVLGGVVTASRNHAEVLRVSNGKLTDDSKVTYKALCDALTELSDNFKIVQADDSALFSNRTISYNAVEKQNIVTVLSRWTVTDVNGYMAITSESADNVSAMAIRLIIGKMQGVKFE